MRNCAMVMIGLVLMVRLSVAQNVNKPSDDIESQRIAFITRQLDLTPQEAQQFWPVYNQYRQDLAALRGDRATKLLEPNVNFDNYTDDQITQLMDNEFDYKQKELDLNRRYNEEYKKVLPLKKIAKLYRAEQLFKVYIIKGNQPPSERFTPNKK